MNKIINKFTNLISVVDQLYSDIRKDLRNKNQVNKHNFVWVVGIPKSGTTLIENILNILAYVDVKSSLLRRFSDKHLEFPHDISKDMVLSVPENKLSYLKTHTHFDKKFIDLISLRKTKVIVTIRDLRDVMLSRYYHIMSDKNHWQFDTISKLDFKNGFIESFECKKTSHPIKNFNNMHYYYYWIKNWKQNYSKYKFLLLNYEEYLFDKENYISKIINYVEYDEDKIMQVSKSLEIKNKSLKKISFDQRLKLHGSKKSTLREGNADNWKKLFDDEISERFKAVLPGPL